MYRNNDISIHATFISQRTAGSTFSERANVISILLENQDSRFSLRTKMAQDAKRQSDGSLAREERRKQAHRHVECYCLHPEITCMRTTVGGEEIILLLAI